MKTMRRRSAAALLVPVLLLAGCGGDDTDDGDDGDDGDAATTPAASEAPDATATDPTSGATEEPTLPPITGDPCRSRVTLTGAVTRSWRTEGIVVTDTRGGPVAVYQSSDGSTALTAYAAGNGFSTSVILNAGTRSYGSQADSRGMTVQDDGSGARVDVRVVAPGGGKDTVRVRATFTC